MVQLHCVEFGELRVGGGNLTSRRLQGEGKEEQTGKITRNSAEKLNFPH